MGAKSSIEWTDYTCIYNLVQKRSLAPNQTLFSGNL